MVLLSTWNPELAGETVPSLSDESKIMQNDKGTKSDYRAVEFENAYQELKRLPSKLIAAQEEERKRIGGELHDSIGQTLAGLKYRIEAMRMLFSELEHSPEALRMFEDLVSTLQLSIEEIRNVYMSLKPTILYELGIIAALQWSRGEFMKLYPEIHVELVIRGKEDDIPEGLKIVIFRISQEALNNVAKHSKAEWVDVILRKKKDRICLTISDNGMGFNPDSILSNPYGRCLGLRGMRERSESMAGTFAIESHPGEGTKIDTSWPAKGQLILPFPKR
jgi:signal transduction histidine kinase